MPESNHTPGPWHINIDETISVRDGIRGGNIARMGHLAKLHFGPRREPKEVIANAHLIAAAPDLLAAAKACRKCPNDRAWSQLIAAIAKAEAETLSQAIK